jgi:hypothetical protein
MDRAEYDAHRDRQVRIWRRLWFGVLALSVGCAYAVGVLWSFAIGIPVGAVLVLAGVEWSFRWYKASWIKRYPELADPRVEWRRH